LHPPLNRHLKLALGGEVVYDGVDLYVLDLQIHAIICASPLGHGEIGKIRRDLENEDGGLAMILRRALPERMAKLGYVDATHSGFKTFSG